MALTQNEISKRFYENRKNNNQCPRCGKILDRQGYYCSDCLIKAREYNKEYREFCRENHICTECKKERVYGEDKICPECRVKRDKYRKPLSDDQKTKMNENSRGTYHTRLELNVCTRCGKRKPVAGKKKCAKCLNYDSEMHRKRYLNIQNIKEYRKENHLCYYCGEPIDRQQGQLCQKCWQIDHERGKRLNSDNKYWRIDNQFLSYKI